MRGRQETAPLDEMEIHMRIGVLIHEPELGEGLTERELREAQLRCTAPIEVIGAGSWAPVPIGRPVESRVLLILSGFWLRRTSVHRCQSVEVLGPGDVLSPWAGRRDDGATSDAKALTDINVAVLDRQFHRTSSSWPDIAANIAGRAAARSSELSALLALTHVARLSDRLYFVLWRLAERWGRVGADGVRLPFRLRQQDLADLVGARRPSVTAALADLRGGERVLIGDDGRFLLPGRGPQVGRVPVLR
jgi:CRP/FNR family cyclic AMP-dependent transcriptional regulator